MTSELTIQNLLPGVENQQVVEDRLRESTFIGIDFGTSTTVVSYTIFGDDASPIKTDTIPIRQLNPDGSFTENHLVPSCIAWYNNTLYIGQTAKMLRSKLTYGRNLWYSFKMKLGTENGPIYFSTELPNNHPIASIEHPLDATKVFFSFLKKEIDNFIQNNNLPKVSYYSISIPASFEANQRTDLKKALEFAGIPFQDSLFIDEPNAAFLSYLIEANANNIKNYNIPLDSPLHILVFDFGAGTCDISILEIGRKSGRMYSKNIAISKFEQLGGDDIDKKIVKEVLFKQLLKQNNLEADDIKTPEYTKVILPKLQPVAEYLKIQICKAVSRNLIGRELPAIIRSEQEVKLEQNIQILLARHKLTFNNPSLSFQEFTSIIEKFTNSDSKFDFQDEFESVKSIFTVLKSAMEKGHVTKDTIDLVLLIGGSSYSPYVQKALRDYFNQSEIEIPRDLQSHVSTGAAVNSFLQNGMNINIIKPIVGEPILILLQNSEARIIIREGTEIPCYKIIIEDLHPQKEGNLVEIPICVSVKEKILSIAKLQSEEGFKTTDNIRLECDISHDKLIHIKAFIKNIEVQVEPLNPFANSALSTEEIAEKRLLKKLNQAARNNGGKPPVNLLKELVNFYIKLEKHLKVAETLEIIQTLEPDIRYEVSICYHYSSAGKQKVSDKWAEIAYNESLNGASAYNLALVRERQGNMAEFERLMEEAISKRCDAAYLVYGEYLMSRNKERAQHLIQHVFDLWHREFEEGNLQKNNYSRLIRAARQIGKLEISEQVKQAQEKANQNNRMKWFDSENLASDSKFFLPQIDKL